MESCVVFCYLFPPHLTQTHTHTYTHGHTHTYTHSHTHTYTHTLVHTGTHIHTHTHTYTHTHTPATPHIHDVSHLARLDLKWVYLNLGHLVRGIYSWIAPSTGVAIFTVAIVTIIVATLVVCLIRSRRKTYKCVIVERDGKQTGNIIIG